MDDQARMKTEAAAFRSLVEHFQIRTDVQNIDLMNLAGFCRNCIWKWYKAAAAEQGIEMTKEQAQEAIYGMSYAQWKTQHQHEATPEQLAKFEETRSLHSEISGHR